MSASPTGSTSSSGIQLPALAPSYHYASNHCAVQLAPLTWRGGRRESTRDMTDGGESTCSESSVPIERLRLASRSVSPVKVLPPMRVRKLHLSSMSAKRRVHPTLDTAPRRIGIAPGPSTAIPRRTVSPPTPGSLLPRTARLSIMKPMTPVILHTPRLMVPPTPRTTKEAQGVGRMVLVNPVVAAHLKKGGVVNVKSRDGVRKWRISLPALATTPVVETSMRGAQEL